MISSFFCAVIIKVSEKYERYKKSSFTWLKMATSWLNLTMRQIGKQLQRLSVSKINNIQ